MERVDWVDEPLVWAMFYSSIVGIQYHPKNAAADRMPLVEAAAVADAMFEQYTLRRRSSWQSEPL